jgi:hypothetical protein
MSFLSGLLRTVAPLALTFITGGAAAPLMATMMKMAAMEVAKQFIQYAGEKLNLPQPIIDMAKMALGNAAGMPDAARASGAQMFGGLARELQLSPSSAGRFERSMNEIVRNGSRSLEAEFDRSMPSLTGSSSKRSLIGDEEEGGSWLVALAKAMGKVMDDKALKMQTLSNEIGAMTGGSGNQKAGTLNGLDGTIMTGKGDSQNAKFGSAISAESTKISSKSSLLQAYGQELGIISNAVTNVLKSVGEANSTLARKG